MRTFCVFFDDQPSQSRPAHGADRKKHILDRQLRITRQKELIGKLERDGHAEVLAKR